MMHMKYDELLNYFADRQLIETQEVAVWFDEPLRQIQVRLSRWVAQKKLIQLRKGKYLLPDRYRRKKISHYSLSNYIYSPSYISLESALEYHGLIPEKVVEVQGVTPRLTKTWSTPLGRFTYQHIKQERFFGYQSETLSMEDTFQCALPEKALIDLFYLRKGEWSETRIRELRLQNPGKIDCERVKEFGRCMRSNKIQRAIQSFLLVLEEL